MVPYLTISLACASIVTSLLFWQIYYPIMCANFLHRPVSMETASIFATGIPFVPHILSVGIALFAGRWSRRPPPSCLWRPVGILLPFIALILTFAVWSYGDLAWGTRKDQERFLFARNIAADFTWYADRPNEYVRGEHFKGNFGTFVDLAGDLPPSAATMPGANELILAIDTIELRDKGVVFRHHVQKDWLYFGHCRAVAFADGHADLVPVKWLPASFARSNARRAVLGLPPTPIPPGCRDR